MLGGCGRAGVPSAALPVAPAQHSGTRAAALPQHGKQSGCLEVEQTNTQSSLLLSASISGKRCSGHRRAYVLLQRWQSG